MYVFKKFTSPTWDSESATSYRASLKMLVFEVTIYYANAQVVMDTTVQVVDGKNQFRN